MKTSSLFALISLLAAPLMTEAQTVIFNDTFANGSTLNGTSTPGGTPSASSTSYDVASSKADTSGPTIAANKLHFALNAGTTAGYTELQAIFASTPVQLVNVGDSINLTITFTNVANTLLEGGNGSVVALGLYNSGGAKPVAGSLNNSGLGNVNTFTNGFCQFWQGYVAQVNSNTFTSKITTRPYQYNTNNANQDLLFSGAGTGLFNTPGGTQIGGSVTAGPTLVNNAKYTMSFTILLSAVGTVSVTNYLYDANGNLLLNLGGTTGAANTYTNYANSYDGLAIGIANKGTSLNPQMDISQITISKNSYAAPTVSGLDNETVVAGTSPTLSPTITGNPTPADQWYYSTDGGVTSNAIAGATGAMLTLTNVQYAQNNYQYTLVASNPIGTNSATMTLSVIVAPNISGLSDQAALVGDTVVISPTITGAPAPTLQWLTNGVPVSDGPDANGSIIAGSATSTLDITNAQVADSGIISLVASNSAGIVTNSMRLTVAPGPILPVITGPTNITVVQGNNGTFSAYATGVPVPSYQWLDQTQTPIPGATSGTLTLTDVQYSQNGYSYYFVASNSVGSVTNSATLTVLIPPVITNQPASLVVTNTQSASFSVVAGGVPTPTYQWYFNSNPISLSANSSAQSATLTFANASPTNIGSYYVQISNGVGSTNSAAVTLTVNSTMSATTLVPQNGQMNVCYDTPFYLTFSSPPVLRYAGKISIYNVTNTVTPVDTLDLSGLFDTNYNGNSTRALMQHSPFPGDSQTFYYYPVVITGTTAAIYPHLDVLTSNQTYYVTIDNGCFTDTNGAYFAGISGQSAWQFNTKPGGPLDPNNPVVAQDYSGDFATVQGALDSLALNANGALRTLNIKNGTYFEIVDIAGKTNVVLRGQSKNAVIKYPNNPTVQAVSGGSTHARMTFKVNANSVSLDNLSITNSTPQGGGQAEALMIESNSKNCVVNNCEIDSRQDTILANGSAQSTTYFNNTTIKGNFDFIWGGGDCFFNQCTIRTISGTGSGQLTAARTDTSGTQSATFPWQNPFGTYTADGFSFVNCSFQSDAGLGNITLAGSNGTSNNLVSWYGCDFATNYIAPSSSLFNGNYLFWQDANTMTNSSVTFPVLTTLSGNDPRLLAATNVTTWFYGWTPTLTPNIISQPTSQSVGAGQSVSFSASGTGIPDPSYQWLLNGSPITGATSTTYNIPSANATNAGNYTVVVSNGSGSVTSVVATLTYVLPVANTATYTRYAGYPLGIKIANLLTNVTDVSPNAVVNLTGTSVSTNGVTLGQSSGSLLYQNPNDVADQFTYTVTDGFGGTNSGMVNVVISNSSVFGSQSPAITVTSGTASILYSGIPGYSYSVNRSTNLISGWTTVWTTNMPAGGVFQFTDPNPPQPPVFYQLLWNWY